MNSQSIATHNGDFHRDEVFAVAILMIRFPDVEFEIFRTRDDDVINSCDWRIDVGKKYNFETNDFDHHQKDTPVRSNGIKYAAFGLLWKHFGAEICDSQEIADKIDYKIVQWADARDNGQRKFVRNSRNLYIVDQLIASMNTVWDDESDSMEFFMKAVEIAKLNLMCEIKRAKAVVRANKYIEEKIVEAGDDALVIEFEYKVPWKTLVINRSETLLYVIVPDKCNNQWMLYCVNKTFGSFELRKPLPKSWWGESKEKLRKITGVMDINFCHANGFCCSAGSLDSVRRLVTIALDNEEKFN